jgi:hypothetical protein
LAPIVITFVTPVVYDGVTVVSAVDVESSLVTAVIAAEPSAAVPEEAPLAEPVDPVLTAVKLFNGSLLVLPA